MDGGYIIPRSVMQRAKGLLSLGLGDDFSFDQDWKRMTGNGNIHLYDGSVNRDSLRININAGSRNHIDIKAEYDDFFQGPTQHINEHIGAHNFVQALEKLGNTDIFIKMDIESSEYGLIESICNNADKILGVVMEWHGCSIDNSQWRNAMEEFAKHFDIVHFHGNNHVQINKDGIYGCMEFTHIRKDLVNSADLRKQVHLPGIDFSNVVGGQDAEYYFE